MDNTEVRQAATDDFRALLSIRNTPRLFKEYLSAPMNEAPFFVFVVDGEMLGFARLKLPTPSDGPNKKRPLISDLFVAPERRSRGIGSAFIGELESMARDLGHRQVYIGVDPVDNPRMVELCKRLGYTPVQVEPYQARMSFHNADGTAPVRKTYWRIELVKHLTGA